VNDDNLELDDNLDLTDLHLPDDSEEETTITQSPNLICCLRIFFRRANRMFQVLLVIITTTLPFAMVIHRVQKFLNTKRSGAAVDIEKNEGLKDAKSQVARIASALEKTKAILASAKTDKATLANNLKGLGIRSASDIKTNTLARRTAEDIGRLSNEIDSYEQKIAAVSTQLLQAKAIVRRFEMEQSGLTDKELADLSRQLHEADTKTDGWTQSISPIELEQAVNNALNH